VSAKNDVSPHPELKRWEKIGLLKHRLIHDSQINFRRVYVGPIFFRKKVKAGHPTTRVINVGRLRMPIGCIDRCILADRLDNESIIMFITSVLEERYA
jgi:hypothetical protein